MRALLLAAAVQTALSAQVENNGHLDYVISEVKDITAGLSDSALISHDGTAYLFGGCTAKTASDTCDTLTKDILAYDAEANTWTKVAELKKQRFGHSAVMLPGSSTVYIIGGKDETGALLQTVETFDAKARPYVGAVEFKTDARFATAYGAAAARGSSVYYCGGRNAVGATGACTTLTAGVVADGPALQPRSNFMLVSDGLTDGKLYAFGGKDGGNAIGALQELPGGATPTWTTKLLAGEPKVRDGAAVYLNQKVYVFGGADESNTELSNVHHFTPSDAAPTWVQADSLPKALTHLSATRQGERVLLAGGFSASAVQQNAYFYGEKPSAHELAVLQLHGSGTTNPSRFFRKWMDVLESRILFPTHVTYRAVGSGAGQSDFKTVLASGRPSVDFACGDIPLSTAVVEEVTQNQLTEVLHIPFALGSISVFHNVPGVPEMKLRACTIAKIFSGVIKTWDHDDIKADIGTTTADLTGKPIKYAVRKGGSSSSFGLSEYLQQATTAASQSAPCKATWAHVTEVSANFPGPVAGGSAGEEVEGSSKMTSFLKTTEYSIGYLDSGHGIAAGLSEVQLEVTQKDGTKDFQASSKADVKKAAEGVTPPAGNAASEWTPFSLQNKNGAWPITMVSYFYVRKDLTGLGSSGSLLKAFIEHVVLSSEGQADAEARYGFVALPTAFLDASKATAATIQLSHEAGKFTLESDTLKNGLGMGDYVISKKRNPKPLDVEQIGTDLAVLTKETKAELATLKNAKSAVTEVVQGTLPTKLSDAAAVHFKDTQYVFGGCVSGSSTDFTKDEGCTTATDAIHKYNPSTHAWDVATEKLSGARFGHTAVVFNKKVYLVGGSVDYIETVTVDAAGALTITKVPIAVVDRKFGAAAVHDGKLYVCGGVVGGAVSATCSLIAANNAVTDSGTPLKTARSNFVLVSSGSTLFAFGGVDGNDRVVGALETLTGGAWTKAVHSGEPELRDAAATYLNQKLFVFGGITPAGATVSDVHTFTPATTTWSVAGSLSAEAAKVAAARVGEQVLLVGGLDGATVLNGFTFFQEAPPAHELAVLQLHGSGTTNPSRFFRKWMDVLESRILFPTHVTYRAVGSGAGQSDFKTVLASGRPSVDFACGDIPLSTAVVEEVTQNQLTEVLHIPFALGSISVFHNVPGVPEMKLRACTIAKIFSGVIKTWDHDDIKADIGTTTADLTGKPIKYAVRKGGSSSSFGLSEYLQQATTAASQSAPCKATWAHVTEVSANFPGPVAGGSAGEEVEGSSKMTSFLKTTEYSIGYLDSGHGIAAGLSEVQLEVTQKDGTKDFQASSKADVKKAAEGVTPPAGNAASEWTPFSLQNKNGAWPITMVSYFYVRKDLTGLGSSGSLLKAFIEHVVLSSEGQADAEARYGFVALPTAFLDASKATAATIQLSHEAGKFTLESDTLKNGLGMGDYVISKKRNPKPLDVEQIGTDLAVLTKETKAELATLKNAKSAVTEVVQGTLPTKLSDAAAVHFKDTQYVFGGCVSGSSTDFTKDEGCTTATDAIHKYNPSTHAWDVATEKLSGARFGHTAVVFNKKVYLVGGSVDYIETVTVDAAGALTITKVPIAVVDRKFGAAAVHDGKLYVCGGVVGGAVSATCSLIAANNAVTDSGTPLKTARSNFVLVSSGSTLFAFGGVDGNDRVVGALETLTGGAWTKAVHSGEPELRDAAATYLNQKLFVFGGITPAGATVSDVHTFTPATTTWSVAGSLSAEAAKVAAARVGEQVLLVGGLDGATVLNGFTFFQEAPPAHELAVLQLHGSGTTNPSRFFRKWMDVLESRILFPTHVTYRAVGSGAGQSDFKTVLASGRPSVDFACGDIPLSTAVVEEVTQNQLTEVLHIPFALGSISVFHNVPGVPEMKLRACTIAKIFSGVIKTWDHDDIKADIGTTTADLTGKPIKYAVRKGGSSSSFGLSEYLQQATTAASQSAPCKATWAHVTEVSANFPGPVAGGSAGEEVEGSSKMTSFLKTTEYSIGYLDSGHGIAAGLSEVQLEVTQKDGTKDFQASSKADVKKAAEGVTPPAGNAASEWTPFSLQNKNGAWPITMVSYFYVRKDLTGLGSSGSLLKAFIEHVVLSSEGQADAEARYGFVALPTAFLDASKATAATIQLSHEAGKFTLESDTLKNGLGMGDYVISKKRNPKPLDVEQIGTDLAVLTKETKAELATLKNAKSAVTEVVQGTLPTKLSDAAAVHFKDTQYVFGGCVSGSSTDFTKDEGCTTATDAIHKYNPSTHAWDVATEKLSGARFGHTAVVFNKKVYLVGGSVDYIETVTVDAAGALTITKVPIAVVDRKFGAAAVHDGKLYVCGGVVGGAVSATCSLIAANNAVTDSGTPLKTARSNFVLVSSGSTLFAFGGVDGNDRVVGALETLTGGAWTKAVHSGEPELRDAAATYLNQKLFVFGGITPAGATVSDVHTFTPATTTWSVAGSLSAEAAKVAAARVGEQVLLVGGLDGATVLNGFTFFQEAPPAHELAVLQLHGSGTTNPSRFFRKWMDVLESRILFPTHVTYRAVGSGAGQSDFKTVLASGRPSVDFACGDIPLSTAVVEEVTQNQLTEVLHIPFALGSISVFHNVPGVPEMKLRACTIAKIFSGVIKTWDHDDIKADIGTTTADLTGKPIKYAVRKGGSSSSFGLSEYLQQATTAASQSAPCKATWAHVTEVSANFPGPVAGGSAGEEVEGSSKMTSFLKTTEYSIGYLDSGHGIAAGLSEVQLEVTQKDGTKDFQASSKADVKKAAEGVTPPAGNAASEWTPFSLQNKNGAWPITMVSYFYVRKDLTGLGSSGSLLKAFIEHVVLSSEGQADAEARYGFVALPTAFLDASKATAATIQLSHEAGKFTLESDTLKNGLGMGDYVISKKRNPKPLDVEQIGTDLAVLTKETKAELATLKNAKSAVTEVVQGTLPTKLSDAAAVHFKDTQYVFGGCVSGSSTDFTKDEGCTTATDAIHKYNPSTHAWDVATEKLSGARFGHTAVVFNKKVYLVGGSVDYIETVTVDAAGALTITKVPIAVVDRKFGAAAVHDGKLYVCGGVVGGAVSATCSLIAANNAVTDSGTPLKTARSNFVLVSSGSTLFAFGGVDGNDRVVGALETLTGGAWTKAVHSGEPELRDAAATYLNQKLFVFGGITPAGATVSDVHTFTPATTTWSVAGSLSAEAAKVAAARVGEQVLLVGGLDGATVLNGFTFFQEAPPAHELAVLQLHGSGTTNPSRFFRKWMDVLESRILFPTHVTYRAVGSGAGQSDFKTVLASGRPSVDFACGDIPLSTAVVEEVTQNQLTEVLHIPFALGSISVFHNVPGVPEMKLRACTIAKIFSGVIKTWDHDDIKADIGTTTADLTGKPIKYAVRKGGSSSSFGLSEYLQQATTAASQSAPCKATWAHVTEVSANFPGPVAGGSAGEEVEGSSKMTSFLKTTEYSIGYLDSGHGIAAGLSEVQLEVTQKDGTKDFQASSKADVKKAAEGVTPPAGNAASEWTPFSLQNKNGAWPITMVSYFYVRKDLTGLGSSGSLLKAFIEHVVLSSEGQADAEARYGFVALPTAFLDASKATAATIQLSHEAGKFTLESDTLKNGLGMGDYVISKKRNPKPLDVEQIGTDLAVLTKETKAELATLKNAKSAVTEVVQGTLPTKLSDAAAVHFKDTQYVFGGCVSGSSTDFTKDEGCTTATDAIHKYNPSTHAWDVATEKLSGARFGHTAVVFNKKVYLVGGSVDYIETVTVDAAGALTITKVPTTGRSADVLAVVDRKFGAAAVHDGKLHVCGGVVGGAVSATCSVIDENDVVTAGESLKTARSNFVLVSSGSTLFAFGGVDGNDKVVGALETLTGGAWTKAVHSGEPELRDAAAAYLNQKLFVYGGITPAGATVSDVHTFTPATTTWSVAGSLSTAASKITAVRVGEQVLLVGGLDGATVLSGFTFFKETPPLHELAVLQLHGSGTTNPSRFFRKWMDVLESRILFPTHVTYRAVGSGAGQSDFKTVLASGRPSVDFACGDIPLSTAVVEEVTQNQLTEVLHIPFALGSISVFHNVPGVPEMKLRACTIAKIFSGVIKTWDHDDIKADIGTTTADLTGKPIKYAVRKGGSSSSFGLSEYLQQATTAASQSAPCKATWAHVTEVSANFPGPVAGGSAGEEVEGSSKMTSFLKTTEYSIGYLDSGHGIAAGLSEVQLEVTQKDGTKDFQASSKADVKKAAEGVTPPAGNAASEWTPFSLQNKNGAWPITMVSYFYVRKDLTGLGSSGSLLKAFIEHVVLSSEGQADAEARYGFVALPTAFLDASKATAATIQLAHEAGKFTLESDTLKDGLGMGDYVISKKRNPKPLDVEEVMTNLALLEARVATLEAKLGLATAAPSTSAPASVVVNGHEHDNNDDAKKVAIAGLIFAIVALVVSLIAVALIFVRAPSTSAPKGQVQCPSEPVMSEPNL